MVKVKKMNESSFAKILKEFNVAGELVRARQEEKQGLLDEFDAECKRFFFGKISERALMASVKKTNRELQRLDGNIRINITKSKSAGNRSVNLVSAQAPVKYRATLSGIIGTKMTKKKAKKKKKAPKKKVKRKKAIPKKKTTKRKTKAKKKKAPAKKRKR